MVNDVDRSGVASGAAVDGIGDGYEFKIGIEVDTSRVVTAAPEDAAADMDRALGGRGGRFDLT